MPKLKMDRRTVLRGAGSIAIALPWLEIMGLQRQALAQTATPAQRFVAVFQPGGTILSQWKPTGTETQFALSPILAPLEPVKSKLLVLQGIDMASAEGEQHQSGIVAWLTGTAQTGAGDYAGGPSIDQVIASRISLGKKARASIQMAVRWATGASLGLLSPINAAFYEDNAAFSPIPPRLDPAAIWRDLFGTLAPGQNGTDAASALARKKSILDFVGARYVSLSQSLGASDRAKLEQHLTKIREVETGLQTLVAPSAKCGAPTLIDTSDYNPTTGLNVDSQVGDSHESLPDVSTDAAIPKVGKLMMDMLVMALACDITAVAGLQWSDTEAKHTFPWLSLPGNNHQHTYEHDDSADGIAACTKIATWYSEQHTYLLQAMDRVDMGGHTLLDESVVFFGSELQMPPTHQKNDMPFLLAGKGGGLRSGRLGVYNKPSHNDLLVSILNLFGDARTTFGSPKHCTGALPGIG